MKQGFMKMISRVLILSLLMLPFQAIQAGMIGTDQVSARTTAQANRDMVLSVIQRSEVASQMQALGLDARTASERVAAMTDDEVNGLANQIDSLPAGAKTSGWAWAAVIIIAVVIWYYWK